MPGIEIALITCEHGGNRVPQRYASLFEEHAALLRSHRGYDRGALELARSLSRALATPLIASTTTRLLVDLNRSLHNPGVFSECTRGLDLPARQRLLEEQYQPHRAAVLGALRLRTRRRPAQLHLAVHSFVPFWKGKRRACDVGFLYDPQRPLEASFARAWRQALRERLPHLALRLNQPYRGWTDGLTTALRDQWSAERYVGIELEVNQRLILHGKRSWKTLQRDLLISLRIALSSKIR